MEFKNPMIKFRQPFKGDYPITLGFGEEYPGLYNKGEHKGIDFGCPSGTPILASADGIVVRVGYEPKGYGNYVLIQHDDMSGTLYAHLSHVMVEKLMRVKKGEQIGMSGSTGNSTGPHLHFEISTQADKISTVIDPVTVLQNVIDIDEPAPAPEKPKFKTVHSGLCVVVCEVANARCHCDMDRVVNTLKRGRQIYIDDKVTMYNGLPYRDYYDTDKQCHLRIAEHDPWDQIIENVDPYGEH